MENKQFRISYFVGIIGSVLLFFIRWEYNIPLMARMVFPLLVLPC